MQLAKSLNVPELPKELDEKTRKVFRKLFENLQSQHRQIRNDINLDITSNWRFVEDGENLLLQKKISGVWTTIGEWSE